MKRLLILGGSQQIGRRLIEQLLSKEVSNYEIYTFNRGMTNPNLFKNKRVTKIIGDRNTADITQILNYDWDIILDCSCYSPISLRSLIEKLKGYVGKYIFISTISVYDYKKNINKNNLITEDFDLVNFTEAQISAKGYSYYGQKKVAAEKCLLESNIDVIILRPHFIYGQYDWQNLDYYWIDRIQKYKEILIPEENDYIHRTYIEDLVPIILESFELVSNQSIYNVMTHEPIRLLEYLHQLSKILRKHVSFISVNSEKLLKSKIKPIIDIPLWSNGSHFIFSTNQLKNDFQTKFQTHYQSLIETIDWNNEIKNWSSGKSKWESGKLGLDRKKEMALIEAELNR